MKHSNARSEPDALRAELEQAVALKRIAAG